MTTKKLLDCAKYYDYKVDLEEDKVTFVSRQEMNSITVSLAEEETISLDIHEMLENDILFINCCFRYAETYVGDRGDIVKDLSITLKNVVEEAIYNSNKGCFLSDEDIKDLSYLYTFISYL